MNILYINDNLSDNSGVCRVMMNYYHLLKERINFSFFVIHNCVGNYYNILKNDSISVYNLNVDPTFRNYNNIKKSFEKYLENNKYDIVEIHCPHYAFIFLPICREKGIKTRIIHAHSSIFSKSIIKSIIGKTLNWRSLNYANEYFSCSDLASKYWFRKKDNITFVPNIINMKQKKKLSREEINEIKKELNIFDKYVIGFVGRLSKEKNLEFLLKVMKNVLKNSNFMLVMVGEGNERKKIEKILSRYNIEDKVLLLGYRDNISDYYQIMDLLLLPSKKEGLPVTLLEAQYFGLPCIASDTLTKQVNLGLVKYRKLKVNIWVKEIKEYFECAPQKKNINLENAFFDEKLASNNLYEKYKSMVMN